MTNDHHWWQRGVFYQIYPLSFMDSNGDGVGDLNGIASRLDYVVSLGVDAIWLSPIYPSPMTDFGYDVADYMAIDPYFGTMADFDRLVADVHRRGLRLILDLVPNHTSDLHPWFLESRASRGNPKRDWYIWRDPAADGGPPNNWVSYFGSAWTFDSRTGQYYYHQFRETQPELNYQNPKVLAAMLEVMRFWLDKGVDGFRVDVIALLAKDQRFLDEPPDPSYRPERHIYHSLRHTYTQDQPAVHDYIRAFRAVLDQYRGSVMLGELDPIPNLMRYYGVALDECHLPFNFNLLYTPWEAPVVRRTIAAYEAALPTGAWPNWILGNHDQPRVASRVGPAQARVAQMLLLTLRGAPICYYGDEIGMADVPIPAHRRRDRNAPTFDEANRHTRDPNRSPMQWSPGPHAGFSEAEPWLPVQEGRHSVNVEAQDRDPRSMLSLFRRLTSLRREMPALSVGASRVLGVPAEGPVIAYERRQAESHVIVALNLGDTSPLVDLSPVARSGDILLSSELDRHDTVDLAELRLRPNEGLIVRAA
jgi:alpha-glucosidase